MLYAPLSTSALPSASTPRALNTHSLTLGIVAYTALSQIKLTSRTPRSAKLFAIACPSYLGALSATTTLNPPPPSLADRFLFASLKNASANPVPALAFDPIVITTHPFVTKSELWLAIFVDTVSISSITSCAVSMTSFFNFFVAAPPPPPPLSPPPPPSPLSLVAPSSRITRSTRRATFPTSKCSRFSTASDPPIARTLAMISSSVARLSAVATT
mmetsp:Transcript_213/g.793  ORF Transcript_213/g.793 Transcript_213/m.793 type:complete len:215 (+) Transcript_213:361-1005(+)